MLQKVKIIIINYNFAVKMEKLDLKDRKILYELDLNSRQSFRSIGKKVGLSKDVVTNRVNNLIDRGIIENFRVVIDVTRLGSIMLRYYIKFQYANQELKKEIIDYFVDSEVTICVISIEGSYDLIVHLRMNNFPQIFSYWNKTLIKYRDYFADQVLAMYYQERYYDLAFLLDDKPKRNVLRKSKWDDIVKIDDLDKKILDILTSDARSSTVDIAKKLNSNVHTINNRMKRLLSTGVIRDFTVSINFPKLGYYIYKVNISLKNHNKFNSILKYVESIPNFFCIDITMGFVDLELEFYLNDSNQLKKIMEDIENKFPDDIRNYDYFQALKIHKYNAYIS